MIFIERYPLKRCQGCVKLIASKVNCFLNINDLSEVQLCMSSNSWTWECPHTKDGADHVPLIFWSSVYTKLNLQHSLILKEDDAFVTLFVGFVLHPLSDSLLFTNLIISSSSQNSWYIYSFLISFCPVPGPVPDSDSSFVFISHLTNFLSCSVFVYVAFFSCLTLPLRKNLRGSKRKGINIYFAFILQVL